MEKNADTLPHDEVCADLLEEARALYSEKVFDRLLHPRNVGEIEEPQGYGKLIGHCGDTIEIYLRILNDKVVEARFLTDGCGTTLAACSMATELASGKTIQGAFQISQAMILKELDGLPRESEHCALLASNALKAALIDYLAYKKEPWKRAYKNS